MSSFADLTAHDKATLEFATRAPRSLGRREDAIRAELDMTMVRYHQRLNVLLDSPAAEREYPQLVHRLQRIRAERDDVRRAAQQNPSRPD